ncbi:hypothetical protein MRX96_013489 [Rhipicephalus microplus]
MTIRFLATGETQRDVAFNFLAGRSTVSSIVSGVSEAFWLVLQPLYLQHPSTTDEWMKISQEFHERWNIPHCLGAIDGKHVTIESPANSGSMNFNYKGSFSKSLLAVCDAQYRFIYVEVGHSGSESDGGIFSRCNLQKNILQGALGLPPVSTVGNEGPLPYFFVSDEAFPLKEHVMRPYARRTLHEDDDKSYERRVFNYRMSRARRTIENTFGILAQRSPQHPPLPIARLVPQTARIGKDIFHLEAGEMRQQPAERSYHQGLPAAMLRGKTTATRFVFSREERELLVNLATRHKAVIENKRTDALTERAKDSVWEKLTSEYNSQPGIRRVTLAQLCKLWDTEKSKWKKKQSEEKRNLYATDALFPAPLPGSKRLTSPRASTLHLPGIEFAN